MTEHNDDFSLDRDFTEPTPHPQAPPRETPASKPEWSLGKGQALRYGSEGPEVDYVNLVLDVDAATFTKATEEAVKKYQSENKFKQTGEVVYVVYHGM